MARRPGAWVASWRLTRRQLELVARGVLPATWRRWARHDLQFFTPGAFVLRTSRRRQVREKR